MEMPLLSSSHGTSRTPEKGPDARSSTDKSPGVKSPPAENADAGQAQAPNPDAIPQTELFYIVSKAWDHSRSQVQSIYEITDAIDDKALFEKLNELYKKVRGPAGRFLSWKSCQDIAFT